MAKKLFFILSLCGMFSVYSSEKNIKPDKVVQELQEAYRLKAHYEEQLQKLLLQTWAAFMGKPSTALNSNTAFDAELLFIATRQEENSLKIVGLEELLRSKNRIR